MDTNTQEDVKMEAKIYKTKQNKGHRPRPGTHHPMSLQGQKVLSNM